ncbi:hypothetical protein [Salinibaculum rarum]|uniref:hypothetical protein n=1 Tax=Salinibaculum rarum TaxID=3058903 RepID=UPI00265DD5A6|nr:hypothetical protein [Salinibaculum sp. KK48]
MTKSHLPSHDAYPYTLEVDDLRDESHIETNIPWCTHGYARFLLKRENASFPVEVESVQEQTRPTTPGWEEGPSILWDFIEKIRDNYYEAKINDSSELPIRVVTHRMSAADDSPLDETCEVYFRGPDGCEYVMWHSDELYHVQDDGDVAIRSELIQKILVAVADAYEDPEKFAEMFGHLRTQLKD